MLEVESRLSILIVDDEEDARKNILANLIPFQGLIIQIEEANDVDEATICIKNKEPDIIFLDIEMPRKNGFELLKAFPNLKSQVIFITSYNTYAIEAFKHFALGYLLKPLDSDDFRSTFSQALDAIRNSAKIRNFGLLLEHVGNKSQAKRIMINSDTGIEILNEDEIYYLEAKRNYTYIFLEKRKLSSSKNLAKFEMELSSKHFFKTHRSFVVNTLFIESILPEGVIILKNGNEVAVSRKQRSKLLAFLSSKI